METKEEDLLDDHAEVTPDGRVDKDDQLTGLILP